MTKGVYDHGLTPILGRGVAAMYQFGSLPHQVFFFAKLKIIFCPNGKKHRPLLSDFFFAPPKILQHFIYLGIIPKEYL